MADSRQKTNNGFTLIELLVVVSILGLISSMVVTSTANARLKAKYAKAQQDLISIRNALSLLAFDTNKWPNGCIVGSVLPPDVGASNEVTLNDVAAGLIARPSVGATDAASGCIWTNTEVNSWNGPYIGNGQQLIDPWGQPYWFDNDYEYQRDCPTPNAQTNPTKAAIVSLGPNQTGGPDAGNYDCDDVTIYIN